MVNFININNVSTDIEIKTGELVRQINNLLLENYHDMGDVEAGLNALITVISLQVSAMCNSSTGALEFGDIIKKAIIDYYIHRNQ